MDLDRIVRKECINRFLGKCKNCTRDYDLTHYPNNYNCCGYTEMNIFSLNVKDNILEHEN